ncbi:SCP2 domain-containing protein, partial [Falsihalocynthiibacter sp. BN13B15]|uniref:ubiquinone anaerobic biosynthesis accessory factor UbiT n=1 Tax=Falsihalocynthiibacter sp. BN13B15 TaxID=3240871 RepID=UPI00350EBE2A
DANIAGPMSALLGLVHGAFDGDALFFSRDLVIEGNTEAVLALRNAIDDAELDIGAELQAVSGPFARPLRRAIDIAQARTGFSLTRSENEGF